MKLSARLFKTFSLIGLVSIILTAVFSTAAFWFVYSGDQNEEIMHYAEKASQAYDGTNAEKLTELYGTGEFRVTVISADGTVLADSKEGDVSEMENHSDRPEFKQAVEQGTGSNTRVSETFNEVTGYCAVKTDNGAVVRVGKTFDSAYGIFLVLIPTVLGIMLCVFAVCAVVSKISTRRIVKPIGEMTESLECTPYDEMLPLYEKIYSQQKQIKKQMRRLQFEKDKISTLIENMAEGFILIDVDKNVLMSNRSAAKLLSAEDDGVTDKTLIAFSRSEELNYCVECALMGESKNADAAVKGRALQIISNPVYSNGELNGAICLIIDVSAKKKAEKMRREFTANVTHELKTPLTSISGYAEIISSGLVKAEDIPSFAGKIHKEAGRLLALISDIMELSKLDERLDVEENTPVDLASVANEVVEDLRANAKKHHVTMNLSVSSAVLKGSRGQLYELIYNLCDNAIRYNKENGSVTVTTGLKDGSPFVSVADTGIGIPEKHHKRIFERFYRVDKSRSKQTGGTGLGLAIVKHIAERHGGTVSLTSGSTGTTFFVNF